MHDVFGVVAWPDDVFLTRSKRRAHGVYTRHKFAIGTDDVVHRFAHAGHDFLVDGDISAVRQLNADVRNRATQRAHGERHHIHGATSHTAIEQRVQSCAHFCGRFPVVGGACVNFFFRTNESALFHTCHVAGA